MLIRLRLPATSILLLETFGSSIIQYSIVAAYPICIGTMYHRANQSQFSAQQHKPRIERLPTSKLWDFELCRLVAEDERGRDCSVL